MFDAIVIGGGPAGLAAAAAASQEGARVCLIERNEELGGILNQCIHDGFGLHVFGEALTGPEFAYRYIERVHDAGVHVETRTMVTELRQTREVICSTRGKRYKLAARAVVLAMGCRERTRGMILIPGERPAGVLTAGVAQWLINEANIMVGHRVVILGSGDVGLIMARRLTWEGARVIAVLEKLPYHSGLARNVKQCLEDYDIPLHLSHTVSRIHGRDRVERVTVTRVDDQGRPIPGSEFLLDCDTLLCSIGLIPENELSRRAGILLGPTTGGPVVNSDYMTSVPGIFSCGNVLHIHDVADWAATEGEQAGRKAAKYALGTLPPETEQISIQAGKGVRYALPQRAPCASEALQLSLRATAPKRDCRIAAYAGERKFFEKPLRRVHPAEMLRITLPSYEFKEPTVIEVSVE